MQQVINKTFAPVGLLLKDGSIFNIQPRTQVDISGLDLDESYFQRLLEVKSIALRNEEKGAEAKPGKSVSQPSPHKPDSPA